MCTLTYLLDFPNNLTISRCQILSKRVTSTVSSSQRERAPFTQSRKYGQILSSEFTPSSKPFMQCTNSTNPQIFLSFQFQFQRPKNRPSNPGFSIIIERVSLLLCFVLPCNYYYIYPPKCLAVGKNDSVDLTLRGNEAMYIVPYCLLVVCGLINLITQISQSDIS